LKYANAEKTVIDMEDGRFIPVDPTNRDYAAMVASNVAIGAYVPPALSPILSPLQFISRFTDAEQLALAQAAMMQAPIKLWYDKLLAAEFIDLTDVRVTSGVDAMVSAGLVTSDRAAAVLKVG